MKMLTGFFALALSFSAVASTIDTKTFVYDGSVNSVELILRAEKTHTEYRVEQTQTTCYRQELAGYRTICTGGYGPGYPAPGPYPRPYPGPYPRPYPGPSRSCWQEPLYRTVPYPCIQTVRVPFEVKDFDVDARVIVDVTKLSPEATPGETFKVTLNGDTLTFDAIGSRKFFIVKKKQDIRSSMNGSVKMMDALLAAELVEAAPLLKAVKMEGISVSNGMVNLNLGPVDTLANLGIELTIVKKKTFGSDKVLFDRELSASEIAVTPTASGADAGINVSKLGVELEDGKFSITAKAFAKFSGNLMNSSQFESLSSSKTLIYKIR